MYTVPYSEQLFCAPTDRLATSTFMAYQWPGKSVQEVSPALVNWNPEFTTPSV